MFEIDSGMMVGESDWSFGLYSPGTDPSEFGHLAPMVGLWQRVKGDRSLPLWKDFDFSDFLGWHRWTALMEVVPGDGPFRLKHRIWGSGLAEMSLVDPTQRFVTVGEAGFDEEDIEFLRQVVLRRCIGIFSGPYFWIDRGTVHQEIAAMPLSTTGETADRIITFSYVPDYH